MIAVTRSAKPAILRQQGADWLTALLRAGTKAAKEKAENKYRNAKIKAVLDAMFHGKCAYCESKIKHVSYPHIEHYYPKSTYPRRTFAWNNLLLACGVCNSDPYKGTQFPTARDGGPYVNPCGDNPDDHFQFLYDPVAKLTSVVGVTQRGTTTETDLGLNRPELRGHRSRQFERLVCLARFAQTDPEARILVNEAKQADAEYSAFANHLL